MRRTSWITLNVLMILSLSACSVYQSQGRKTFDTYSLGRTLKTNVGISSAPNNKFISAEEEDCWTQPNDQDFWSYPADSILIVQDFNEKEITYCLGRPDETSNL